MGNFPSFETSLSHSALSKLQHNTPNLPIITSLQSMRILVVVGNCFSRFFRRVLRVGAMPNDLGN